MRTKTFLLTAAVGAVGLATSLAQVYSVNAVGYVNLTLSAGYNLICNPLNGTNNHLNTILPLPDSADGTTVFRFNAGTQSYYDPIQFVAGFGWFTADPGGDDAMTINPGEGFFIEPYVNGVRAPLSVTFVGDVPQGTLTNPLPGPSKYAIRSSIVPQGAPIGEEGASGTLLFAAEDGDTIFIFDAVTQSYKDAYQYVDGFGWFSANPDDPGPQGPTIPVGVSFFLQKSSTATKTAWVRNFSVN